jgi:hypothetical protein
LLRISTGFLLGGPIGLSVAAGAEAFFHGIGEVTSEGINKISELLSQSTSGELTKNEISILIATGLFLPSGRIKSHSAHGKMGDAKLRSKLEKKLESEGWVKKDGVFHHPNAKNMKDIIPNKPNAQDPKLQSLYDQIYRPTDKTPGGTMQILKEEFLDGIRNPEHLIKAEQRLRGITKIILDKKNPLSRADLETAQNVQRLLRESIKLVKGS